MKRSLISGIALAIVYVLSIAVTANAQETFTGTVVRYGSGAYTGLRTAHFTLTINSQTPNDDAQRFLASLKDGGQDALMNAVKGEDLGRFSLDQGLARTINAVREVNSGGKRKIYAIFERWEHFAEVRGGYRSLDYPFGYLELTIDPATGKGSGRYFAAAKIHWKTDNDKGSNIEIEDYATIPARLTNVESRAVKP